jgi:hypothetical protein
MASTCEACLEQKEGAPVPDMTRTWTASLCACGARIGGFESSCINCREQVR